MSKTRLPKQIEPIRLAERRAHIEGILALAEMPRLTSLLCKPEGDVSVVLDFGVDAQGLRYVKGVAEVAVTLTCQRCMQPFNYQLKSEVLLSPVSNETAAGELPSDYEPVMVSAEGLVTLNDMVEDDLILALPLVTAHEPAACSVKMISAKSEVARSNAFEVLKAFKKDKSTD